MKYLFILSLALLFFSCSEPEFPLGCEIDVRHNDKTWQLRSCNIHKIHDGRWGISVNAAKAISGNRHNADYLIMTHLPLELGTHRLENGILLTRFDTLIAGIVLQEIMGGDVVSQGRILNDSANNFIRIDYFDPQSGQIKGAFHTEWINDAAFQEGPFNQTIACTAFEFFLAEL